MDNLELAQPIRRQPPKRRYLGVAHIVIEGQETYASCPMYTDNLELLQQWLEQNHAALSKRGTKG